MKKLILFICLSIISGFSIGQKYWQQEVNYTISVKLDDINNSISGFEEFEYINNSPNDLNEIYMHWAINEYRFH